MTRKTGIVYASNASVPGFGYLGEKEFVTPNVPVIFEIGKRGQVGHVGLHLVEALQDLRAPRQEPPARRGGADGLPLSNAPEFLEGDTIDGVLRIARIEGHVRFHSG